MFEVLTQWFSWAEMGSSVGTVQVQRLTTVRCSAALGEQVLARGVPGAGGGEGPGGAPRARAELAKALLGPLAGPRQVRRSVL